METETTEQMPRPVISPYVYPGLAKTSFCQQATLRVLGGAEPPSF